SVYAPQVVQAARGSAAVRIREVTVDAAGNCIVQGTLATQERLNPSPRDLVWMRLSLASGPIDLYGRLEREWALASAEWRFRAVGGSFGPDVAAQLKAAEGAPLTDVPFEHLPMLSSPCDLYALGVLAVRALLVNASTPLPVALDELFSLAKQLAVGEGDEMPL